MAEFLEAIRKRNSQTVEKLLFSLLPKAQSNTQPAKAEKTVEHKAKISPRQKWHHQEKAATLVPATDKSSQSNHVSQTATLSDKNSRKKPNFRILPAVPIKSKAVSKVVKSLSTEMREAEEKKRQLLQELREVDHTLKELKMKDKLSRKPKSLLPEDTAEQTKKALDLVKKLNEQRKQRELKKQQEAQQLELRANQSIDKMAQMKKMREEEKHQNMKEMVARKAKERESRTALRHLNTESDRLIGDMKKHNSVFDLTSVQDDPLPERLMRKKYPHTHFLDTIISEEKAHKRQEEMKERQKKLLADKRKSYGAIIDKFRVEMLDKHRNQSIEMHYEYQHSPIVAKRVDGPTEG